MSTITVKIIDPIGLHARPASLVVSEASKFESEITITYNGNSGNLKSIMNIMALGVKEGQEITIEAVGGDSEQAIASLEKIMKENNLI